MAKHKFEEPTSPEELRSLLMAIVEAGHLDYLRISRPQLNAIIEDVVACSMGRIPVSESIKALGQIMLAMLEQRIILTRIMNAPVHKKRVEINIT